ncbi:hypothetical protein OEZ49_07895 [Ruegeria sp. WL0004]|uniref:Cellulose-binding protein n=1 Tax=Ruegeria marisflavi TaxID=2984152 RepID=A0ABT2WRR8_9RHOB|nr:hypothetical protein [Ruegeria sp. WL0004]MCU9837685.1 hypothetical protein [Ruegeria sp. WL0004]
MNWIASLIGVLFIGHSLFGPTNPDMLSAVLKDTGVRVEAQIINGAPLSYNWENGDKAEGVNAREVLSGGGFDAVILTEAIPLANQIQHNDSVGYARRYYDLAVTANPQARVFLQETWHDLRSGSGARIEHDAGADIPWRNRIEQDLAQWQSIVDGVNETRPTGAPPMRLLPAGQAMLALTDAIAEGTVPGLDRISQVFHDDIHPNDLGFYFLTMVQYAALIGESPVGLPHRLKDRWGRAFDAPNPAQAARLQTIAWEAVQAYVSPAPPAPVAPKPEPEPEPVAVATETATALEQGYVPPPEPDGPVALAIGLAGVNDWSVQQPFLDVFKTARPWIGHLPRQFGGASYDDLQAAGYLDENGWPQAIPPELGSVGTLILTDLPVEATSVAGRYVLRFDGQGIVEVTGRAENIRYGRNRVEFDYTPGPGLVDIRIQRTHRGGDYVRNINVVKEENLAAFDAGARFNPDWLDRLQGFRALRFMDWMQTNNSQQAAWEGRPKPADFSWAVKGVPVEIMVDLLNRTGADGWFNMPHLADDDYFRRFAETVRDTLWIEQRAYVELSNEVWNWQFTQAQWAEDQARARWNKKDHWVSYYAARAVKMADIWAEVYGDQAEARLVRVISTQTGWIGLEEMILDAPAWVAEEPGRAAPARHFDAYAVTGYFGGTLGWEQRLPMLRQWLADSRAEAAAQAEAKGLTGSERDAYMAEHRFDLATSLAWAELRDGAASGDATDTLAQNLGTQLPYHAAVAAKYGLDLIMYEGGSHVVGLGPLIDDEEITAFFTHFNYSDEMGDLYTDLIRGWHAAGGKLFTAYADVYRPNKWGSWGHLRHLDDANPRWDALVEFLR